jgi:hypothetical protein
VFRTVHRVSSQVIPKCQETKDVGGKEIPCPNFASSYCAVSASSCWSLCVFGTCSSSHSLADRAARLCTALTAAPRSTRYCQFLNAPFAIALFHSRIVPGLHRKRAARLASMRIWDSSWRSPVMHPRSKLLSRRSGCSTLVSWLLCAEVPESPTTCEQHSKLRHNEYQYWCHDCKKAVCGHCRDKVVPLCSLLTFACLLIVFAWFLCA